jgi:hypothetical protein
MLAHYYVYEHRRKDTGAVFYVGKGKGQRAANAHNRNPYWARVSNKANGFSITYPVKDVEEDLALLAEVELIDAYRRRGVKITNITDGGEGAPGWVPTEETKRRIGEANRYTAKASGEQHGMYGKKHTPESLAKMSAAQKGRLAGEKHPMYGKHHTDEAKAKVSAAKKGKQAGENNPFYGKKHDEATRRLISEFQRGRKASEETKAKKRASALASAPNKQPVRPVVCTTNGVRYYGLNDAARQLGLHRQSIRMVCNGKLKQTGGFKFEWSVK